MESIKKYDLNGIFFELTERYQPIKMVGRGTYGAVISASDMKTNAKVAIKKLAKIEDAVSISTQVDAKRVLREILIMKSLDHENILGLIDVLYVPSQT
jgi:serine/threonine protein kinase